MFIQGACLEADQIKYRSRFAHCGAKILDEDFKVPGVCACYLKVEWSSLPGRYRSQVLCVCYLKLEWSSLPGRCKCVLGVSDLKVESGLPCLEGTGVKCLEVE